MTLVAVAPDKYARGFDGSGRVVPEAYEVLDLCEALGRVYSTDAHLVTYVVEGATRQARINKLGLAKFPVRVSVGVFFCDIDNAGHAPWNAELVEAAQRDYETIPALQSAGIYHTQHGRRIVQPILEPIDAGEVEPFLKSWLRSLSDAGLPVDWACRDWTRHFRLPHVRRAGIATRSPLVLLERMRPIAAPEPEAPAPVAGRSRIPRPVSPMPETWAADVPDEWKPIVQQLADGALTVSSDWHALFLAIAGALLSRGVAPALVPALVRAVSISTRADSRTADREVGARSTIARWAAGGPITGFGELLRKWPAVAAAFDVPAPESPPVAPPLLSLGEVRTALVDAIRKAPDGLTVIAAECGIGKTAAAIEVASERARKPHTSPKAKGLRAPAQSKTAISVDKNALAVQVVAELRSRGIPTRRIFGPLSCKDSSGEPVCKLADIARPLVDGGQPMQWELCRGRDIERCPHYDDCEARDGMDGDTDARVIVGSHSLLGALDGEAGSTGLLVIDEPPPLLESVVLSGEDLDDAERCLGWFDGCYAGAMLPALQAVRVWVGRFAELESSATLAAAVRSCERVVLPEDLAQARRSAQLDDEADAIACAIAAPLDERRGKAPPISFVHLRLARDSASRAQSLGTASRVLRTLHHGLTSETPVAARVEERAGERVLVVTRCNEQLAKAVKRQGAVVVTDANADLHAPILRKVAGYDPPLHRFAAVDGAPIRRSMIRCPSATRTSWLRAGSLEVSDGFVSALEALFAWAQEDPTARKLGVITLLPIEMALRAARGEQVDPAWEPLDDARVRLGSIVQGWPGELVWGHFGGVRGMNSMADVDCLATLGDPWPNLGLVKSDVAFLGLTQAWEQRVEAMCKAELEQAHGRIRAVHRTKPGRALHIGNVMPSGSGWRLDRVEVRGAGISGANKRPHGTDLLSIVTSLGGITPAAGLAGVS
ncbi:MAG: hypothetical protein MUF54_02915, partial [Polyangiaceae bacterium]|nr:hypothetical protein [Polyangiaceae bacterium]